MRRLVIATLLFASSTALAQAPQKAAPAYDPEARLLFPTDYREWIYLSSDFDLSYAEGLPPNTHIFGNVFVDRDAYAAFQKTKAWPDRTMLLLELRPAGGDNPLNKRGQYQAGPPAAIEMHVKDASKGGWGFYAFDNAHAPAQLLPRSASCYACHEQHAATDTTFTQFYPTLAEAAVK